MTYVCRCAVKCRHLSRAGPDVPMRACHHAPTAACMRGHAAVSGVHYRQCQTHMCQHMWAIIRVPVQRFCPSVGLSMFGVFCVSVCLLVFLVVPLVVSRFVWLALGFVCQCLVVFVCPDTPGTPSTPGTPDSVRNLSYSGDSFLKILSCNGVSLRNLSCNENLVYQLGVRVKCALWASHVCHKGF